MKQLSLFGGEEPAPRKPAPTPRPAKRIVIEPADPAPEHVALAEELPPGVHLGTSTWSFPGWTGIVYRRDATTTELARYGLRAYASHPLLRGVGIDRTFYAPIEAKVFARYAADVPADFRFLVKAHELCTLPRYGTQNRYHQSAGLANSLFLEPGYAAREVIAPAIEGLGERLGPIVFQFTPLRLRGPRSVTKLLERLDKMLATLPAGPLYATEIRNEELLTPQYAAVLAAHGAAHCYTVHPTMPAIQMQAEVVAAGGAGNAPLVARWMLGGGQGYNEARARYAPFNKLIDEDPISRDDLATLALEALRRGQRIYITVNNKAEGSAPLSVFKLAQRIVQRVRAVQAELPYAGLGE